MSDNAIRGNNAIFTDCYPRQNHYASANECIIFYYNWRIDIFLFSKPFSGDCRVGNGAKCYFWTDENIFPDMDATIIQKYTVKINKGICIN